MSRAENQNNNAGQADVAGTVKTKLLVLALDYDGCLGQFDQCSDEPFLDFVVSKIKKYLGEGFEACKVILVIGSNRQSPDIDRANMEMNENGSCATLLPTIQSVLNKSLQNDADEGLAPKVSIECCRFMMPDLYCDKPVGTTLDLIEKQNAGVEDLTENEKVYTVFDSTKITLLFALMQYIASQHPEFSIDFCLFDDQDPILSVLNEFFENRVHLPKNCRLSLIRYLGLGNAPNDPRGKISPDIYKPKQGTGKIEVNLRLALLALINAAFPEAPYDGSFVPSIANCQQNRLTFDAFCYQQPALQQQPVAGGGAAAANNASNDVVHAALCGDEALARQMIELNPNNLLQRGNATDFSGRTYENITPFQAALVTGDVEMAEMMKPFFECLPNYEAKMQKQFNEIFPKGMEANIAAQEQSSKTKFIPMLEEVFEAINKNALSEDLQAALYLQDNGSALCKALDQFRGAFTELSRSEKIFNPNHLIKANAFYMDKFGEDGRGFTNNEQLFWRQVIGFVQRFLPANYAQALAYGLCDIVVGNQHPCPRTFNFKYDPGVSFFPLADSSGLGFHYAVGYETKRESKGRQRSARWTSLYGPDSKLGNCIQHLYRTKTGSVADIHATAKDPALLTLFKRTISVEGGADAVYRVTIPKSAKSKGSLFLRYAVPKCMKSTAKRMLTYAGLVSRHPNFTVLRLGVEHTNGTIDIDVEYSTAGNLETVIPILRPEDRTPVALSVVRQVVESLLYAETVHDGQRHFNINSRHIYLNINGNVKTDLYDTVDPATVSANSNQFLHIPPEFRFDVSKYLALLHPGIEEKSLLATAADKVDVWALGVLIIEIITGRSLQPPRHGQSSAAFDANVAEFNRLLAGGDADWKKMISDVNLRFLARGCLQEIPVNRFSLADANAYIALGALIAPNATAATMPAVAGGGAAVAASAATSSALPHPWSSMTVNLADLSSPLPLRLKEHLQNKSFCLEDQFAAPKVLALDRLFKVTEGGVIRTVQDAFRAENDAWRLARSETDKQSITDKAMRAVVTARQQPAWATMAHALKSVLSAASNETNPAALKALIRQKLRILFLPAEEGGLNQLGGKIHFSVNELRVLFAPDDVQATNNTAALFQKNAVASELMRFAIDMLGADIVNCLGKTQEEVALQRNANGELEIIMPTVVQQAVAVP